MVPLALKGLAHLQVEIGAGNRHHGYQHKNDSRQQQIHSGQNHERNHGLYKRDKKLLRTAVGKLRHVKQIAGDPGHDLPYLGVVKIIVRQLLQVFKSVLPHIRLNSRPHHMACIRHVKAGHAVNDPQDKVQTSDSDHHTHRERRQVIHAHIGDIPQDQRKDQLTDGRKTRAEQIHHHDPYIFSVIRDKPF